MTEKVFTIGFLGDVNRRGGIKVYDPLRSQHLHGLRFIIKTIYVYGLFSQMTHIIGTIIFKHFYVYGIVNLFIYNIPGALPMEPAT